MSKHWLEANGSRLMAEILRDFCAVSIALEEQFTRYDDAGNISYAVIRETLGEEMNRGILWRLKDTAHHLLRNAQNATVAGKLLDWAIGYIFHETLKLLEDTHQHQYYAPSLFSMAEDNPSPELTAISRDFTEMALETQEDMGRAVSRIRKLLAHARLFFHRCYAGQKDNMYLARLLYDREELVREAFAGEYDNFRAAVYGKKPHMLYVNAAVSLAHGGRRQDARAALEKAESLAPEAPETAAARKTVFPG
ncbi:conserved hypothetical protein [uncultured delta proteobacterium]|uniref:Uncharacterized protein n=1 Tax=uncultured delta proteobacterium TaxID=34034 RepID=A0A212IT49_9DELT|nr:conserved hypothetical protein [uncultured delta proteobacterium]